MAREAKQVRGVYEHVKGSGIWFVRYRLDGKLVRKKIGTQAQAKTYLDKLNYVRASGRRCRPPVRQAGGQDRQGGSGGSRWARPDHAGTTMCQGLKAHIASDPEHYRDQYNPPRRIARIKAAFGNRPAASIRPFEISNWLSTLKTPKGKRISDGTWNRYRTMFSSIYAWGRQQEMILLP